MRKIKNKIKYEQLKKLQHMRCIFIIIFFYDT